MTRASERLGLAERVHAFIEDSLGAVTPEAFEAHRYRLELPDSKA